MAKIFSGIFCILLLCVGCHHRVSENGIEIATQVDSTTVKEVIIIDSVPVVVKAATDSIITIAPEVPEVKAVETLQQKVKPQLNKSLPEIYLSQLGVRELTGNNDGPDVEKYLKSVGLGKGYAWCAAYVKWCMNEAKIKTPINGAAASCLNKNNLVMFKHKFDQEAKTGDVFVLWYNSLNRIGHTGFYHKKVNATVFESVEGNTNEAGSREGDGVYKKYRSFNATYAISRWQ
jgi:hypothetical protein